MYAGMCLQKWGCDWLKINSVKETKLLALKLTMLVSLLNSQCDDSYNTVLQLYCFSQVVPGAHIT